MTICAQTLVPRSKALRDAGVRRIVMLTGDNARTARAIAEEVGVDDVFADLKPDQKVEKVRGLSAQYGHIAMVGDGVKALQPGEGTQVNVTLPAAIATWSRVVG